jgi:hypothetical protein
VDVPPADGVFDGSFLERIGHPVRVCHGPAAEAICPVVAGVDCEKFDVAHGIVFELDFDRPQQLDDPVNMAWRNRHTDNDELRAISIRAKGRRTGH